MSLLTRPVHFKNIFQTCAVLAISNFADYHNPSLPLWRCHKHSNLCVRAVWVRLLQCSSFWLPQTLDRLPKVQNNADGLIFQIQSCHTSFPYPILVSNYLKKKEKRIDFKFGSLLQLVTTHVFSESLHSEPNLMDNVLLHTKAHLPEPSCRLP